MCRSSNVRCRVAAFARALGPIAGAMALSRLFAARAAPEATEVLLLPAACPQASAAKPVDAGAEQPCVRS